MTALIQENDLCLTTFPSRSLENLDDGNEGKKLMAVIHGHGRVSLGCDLKDIARFGGLWGDSQ